MNYRSFPSLIAAMVLAISLNSCGKKAPEPGTIKDEALMAGRDAKSFPAADEDYFKAMDGAVALTANEVKGRNNWIVWSGGNDRFWDYPGQQEFRRRRSVQNTFFPSQGAKHLSRDKRWQYLGVVNEPCFEKAQGAATPIVSACGSTPAARIVRPIPLKTSKSIPA